MKNRPLIARKRRNQNKLKRGEQPSPEVNAWRLRLHKEFVEAFALTELPERPDYEAANRFLMRPDGGLGQCLTLRPRYCLRRWQCFRY